MSDHEAGRRQLVERLEAAGTDSRVADALARVPRHRFLPPDAEGVAYADEPVPIGEGQTASAPHMVALMAQALDLEPGQRVLEVGSGCGYHAAVAAELVHPGGRVVSLEVVPTLARKARATLDRLGYGADRVRVVEADGAAGFPEEAPYDRAWVACAAPRVPPALLRDLRPGGRLLVPVGDRDLQELTLVEPDPEGEGWRFRPLGPCRFVPLTGPHGFP